MRADRTCEPFLGVHIAAHHRAFACGNAHHHHALAGGSDHRRAQSGDASGGASAHHHHVPLVGNARALDGNAAQVSDVASVVVMHGDDASVAVMQGDDARVARPEVVEVQTVIKVESQQYQGIQALA